MREADVTSLIYRKEKSKLDLFPFNAVSSACHNSYVVFLAASVLVQLTGLGLLAIFADNTNT